MNDKPNQFKKEPEISKDMNSDLRLEILSGSFSVA